VHRSDALQGQQVVHVGEHAFLHLAAVPGVDDYLHLFGQVEHDGRLRVQAEPLVLLDLGFRGVEHHEVGLAVLLEFGIRRTDEHVLDEVRLPGHLHDEADFEAGVLVGTAEGIHHVELLVGKLLDGDLLELLPGGFGHGLVVVLVLGRRPPDRVAGHVVHHEELILGRTAGVNAGHHVYRAGVRKLPLLVAAKSLAGLLAEKLVVRGIIDDLLDACNPVLFQIIFIHNYFLLEHPR
jgi:hypothetical protein